MNKKVLNSVIIAVVAIFISVIVVMVINSKKSIPEIKAGDVERVYYDGYFDGHYGQKELDIDQFVEYYNEIDNIKENKNDEGTTPESWIVIELKDGSEVRIYDQSMKFEVVFEDDDGEIKQYWGEQEQIYNMLRTGSYERENKDQ